MPFRPSREGDRVNLLHPQKSEKLLSLALTYGSPRQWGEWLRLPLVGAAVEGDAALVKELLAAGADGSAGQMNTDGSTLLHAAADGGSEQVMKALLAAGADADCNKPRLVKGQEFPLHVAAKSGNAGVCSALITAGAKVNCRDRNGWTPLHLAARFGQVEVVINLLRGGADREAEDVNGYRPLHYATMWGHPDTTKTLLEAGATLEPITRVEGTRPLHIAARYGSPLIVQELLSHGADKDARTYRGFTPLHAAAASNKAGVTSLLVKAGADINLPDGHLHFTPLHLAARRGAVQAAAILLYAGADVDVKTDREGNTPLHLACAHLKPAVAQLLLRHGADETARNHARNTPAEAVVLSFDTAAQQDVRYRKIIDGIKHVLSTAPAERAWLRRGWLVMARTGVGRRPRRHQKQSQGAPAPDITAAELSKTSPVGEGDKGGAAEKAVAGGGICRVWGKEAAASPGIVEGDERGGGEEGSGAQPAAKVVKLDGCGEFRKAQSAAQPDERYSSVVEGGGVGRGDGSGGPEVWGDVVGRVAGLKEEGIFQKIVLFL